MRTRERETEKKRITCTEAADIRFLYLLLSQNAALHREDCAEAPAN